MANKKVNKQQNARDTTQDMGTRLCPLVSEVAGKKELQVTTVNFSESQRISRTHCRLAGVWEAGGRRPGRGGSWLSNPSTVLTNMTFIMSILSVFCQSISLVPQKQGVMVGVTGILSRYFEIDLLLQSVSLQAQRKGDSQQLAQRVANW